MVWDLGLLDWDQCLGCRETWGCRLSSSLGLSLGLFLQG